MNIRFFGAAGSVTGSCHMLDTGKFKFLVDCGLFQGSNEIKERNYADFLFNPADVDFVLLTHAHIDHSGLIPKLCKKGFKGKIYCTNPTKDLCSILLPDTAHIQEMEVERKNRKLQRAGKDLLEPIFNMHDAEMAMQHFNGVSYGQIVEINDEIKVRFRDAGHILGSAIIEVFVSRDDKEEIFVFSGDLGNIDQPIVEDPTFLESADYIVMESTYGNRFHLETEDKITALAQIIKRTMRKGGNLVIPAFAVERTQDIIYYLKELIEKKEIPLVDIYIDSPLAVRATEIFSKFKQYYDKNAKSALLIDKEGDLFKFPRLKYSLSADDSKMINQIKGGAIIISASGMADAGRIKHHLKHNLWRPESSVLFVGYQAQGTLGRRILDGEKNVRIHGENIAVKADIYKIDGFSAHADQKGLLHWISKFKKKPKKIFVVHGEKDSAQELAKLIKEEFNISALVPNYLDEFKLTETTEEKNNNKVNYQASILASIDNIQSKLKALLQNQVDQQELESTLKELENLERKL